MAKRTGLGQRGLDLLISGSPQGSSRAKSGSSAGSSSKKTTSKKSTSSRRKSTSTSKNSKNGTTRSRKSGKSSSEKAVEYVDSLISDQDENKTYNNEEMSLNETAEEVVSEIETDEFSAGEEENSESEYIENEFDSEEEEAAEYEDDGEETESEEDEDEAAEYEDDDEETESEEDEDEVVEYEDDDEETESEEDEDEVAEYEDDDEETESEEDEDEAGEYEDDDEETESEEDEEEAAKYEDDDEETEPEEDEEEEVEYEEEDEETESESDEDKVAEYEDDDEEETEPVPTGTVSNEPLMVPLSKVEPNRSQPRKNFDEEALQELADSIRQFGIIQPLIVQKKEDYYEIIAGERRWRAARLASLKEVPVIVKEYTPREVMEISLIENIQREDLNPIEEASAFKRLMEEYGLKQDEVAERVSKSRAAIANTVRLLNLDSRVQEMIICEMISRGHARALLSITDPEVQYATAQKIFDEKMTVRDVEKLVKKMNQQAPESPVKKKISEALQAVYMDLSEKMKASLGTKVSIAPKSAQKGKIEIEYYSQDELDRLCSLLNSLGQREEG